MGRCGLASSSLSEPEGGVDGLGIGRGVVGLGGEEMAMGGVPWLMGCWLLLGVRRCGVACLGGCGEGLSGVMPDRPLFGVRLRCLSSSMFLPLGWECQQSVRVHRRS